MKNMTNKEYNDFVFDKMPKSSFLIKALRAFLVGGIICVIGQVIFNLISELGLEKETVSSYTSISMIFLGALLTGLNVYDNIAKFAGAGTLVPITGFSNAVVSPAMEFKSEGYVLGVGAKMFVIAGPVIVYGIVTSIICGLFILLGNTVF
jgi:stage V sporulation protein AC